MEQNIGTPDPNSTMNKNILSNGEELRSMVDRLLGGVSIPDGLGEFMQAVEQGGLTEIREMLATFAAQEGIESSNIPNAWSLVEKRIPIPSDPEQQGQRNALQETMSKPLVGRPSDVIASLGLRRESSLLRNSYQNASTESKKNISKLELIRTVARRTM